MLISANIWSIIPWHSDHHWMLIGWYAVQQLTKNCTKNLLLKHSWSNSNKVPTAVIQQSAFFNFVINILDVCLSDDTQLGRTANNLEDKNKIQIVYNGLKKRTENYRTKWRQMKHSSVRKQNLKSEKRNGGNLVWEYYLWSWNSSSFYIHLTVYIKDRILDLLYLICYELPLIYVCVYLCIYRHIHLY